MSDDKYKLLSLADDINNLPEGPDFPTLAYVVMAKGVEAPVVGQDPDEYSQSVNDFFDQQGEWAQLPMARQGNLWKSIVYCSPLERLRRYLVTLTRKETKHARSCHII